MSCQLCPDTKARFAALGVALAMAAATGQPAYAANCSFVVAIAEDPSERRARLGASGILKEKARAQLRSDIVVPRKVPDVACSGYRTDPAMPGTQIFACITYAVFCTIRVPRPIDPDIEPPPSAKPDPLKGRPN